METQSEAADNEPKEENKESEFLILKDTSAVFRKFRKINEHPLLEAIQQDTSLSTERLHKNV